MAFLVRICSWKIEKGTIEVEIGSSSDDIRLTGSYEVTENGWVAGKDRAFYAKAAVE